MSSRCTWLSIWLLGAVWLPDLRAADVQSLRLVPFPKEIKLTDGGTFSLKGPLVLEAPAEEAASLQGLIAAELKRAGLPEPAVRATDAGPPRLRLSRGLTSPIPAPGFRAGATPQDYALDIGPEAAVAAAPDRGPGLLYAVQTLCQLIRANRQGDALPGLSIRDWPSLRWRSIQDDLTRGPSSRLETLRLETSLAAWLKMNLITYYMEYQFAFAKHPDIGPKDGSLTPAELAAWVAYANTLHVDVLGNQQSFGHWGRILALPRYAGLRETADVLCPTNEQSYQLLDDLYSEVCPLLPLPMFNVCCDETWGLGQGPSKELAEKIGVGGVYVRHIRRVHDILAEKYRKRMMMWGDIILQHPDRLQEIPKDTIMLTWGYSARPSFENQIIPFAQSGYEFFVCPGCSNWSRILPDFSTANTNIRNFVRDGAKHGAIGMINTDWQDDGESLKGVKWHADAWAAECAWNASATELEAFNRRVGAVLFGERDDHFGQAVAMLAETHRLPRMHGMNNRRFWQDDFPPLGGAAAEALAHRLLALVRPAIEHLEACRKEACVNAELLDCFLHGARRMETIGQRMLDGLEAGRLYQKAYEAPPAAAAPLLTEIETLVGKTREAHEALGRQFAEIWLRESKPYALDWTMRRYEATGKRYGDLARRLAEARRAAEAGKPLPSPETIGLALEAPSRPRTHPTRTIASPLAPDAPWAEPSATHRLGLVVRAGAAERCELPVEIDVTLPRELAARPVAAYVTVPGSSPCQALAQLDPPPGLSGRSETAAAPLSGARPVGMQLVVLIPARIPQGGEATIHVYLGLPEAAARPRGVRTGEAPRGMKWIENEGVRLLLGPEGGHVYAWEVKALGNRDITQPGMTGWAGFSDGGGEHRSAVNTLTCLARGPAIVRYRATEPFGFTKTVTVYGDASWVEVVLDEPVRYYWDFDDPRNFAADGATPGKYLFSSGATGPVGKAADGVRAQVKAPGAFWSIKFNPQKLALGLVTPEVPATHVAAPGGSAGGVGIEHTSPVRHFVTYGGILQSEPGETMERLRRTLDSRKPPEVVIHGLQASPAQGSPLRLGGTP